MGDYTLDDEAINQISNKVLEQLTPTLSKLLTDTVKHNRRRNESSDETYSSDDEDDDSRKGIIYKMNNQHKRYIVSREHEPPKPEEFNGNQTDFMSWWVIFDAEINQRRKFTASQKTSVLKRCLKKVKQFRYDQEIPHNDTGYIYLLDKLHGIFNDRDGALQLSMNRLSSINAITDPGDHEGLSELLSAVQTILATNNTRPFNESDRARITESIIARLPPILKYEIARWSREERTDLSKLVDQLCFAIETVRPKLSINIPNVGIVASTSKISKSPSVKILQPKPLERPAVNYRETSVRKLECYFCQHEHKIADCPLSIEDRKKVANQQGRCLLCLRFHHGRCPFPKRCYECNENIHHSLCGCKQTIPKTVKVNLVNNTVSNNGATRCFKTVLLHTLSGDSRALFDGGAGINLITATCVKRLNLQQNSGTNFLVSGITNHAMPAQSYVRLHPTFEGVTYSILCYVVDSIGSSDYSGPADHITDIIRTKNINIEDDPSKPVEIVLNLNESITHIRHVLPLPDGYALFQSNFGWMVAGGYTDTDLTVANVTSILEYETSDDDHRTQEQFLRHFLETNVYEVNNRWEVRLPIMGTHKLETNLDRCRAQLFRNVARYRKSGMYEKVNQIFQEWQQLDIIETVSDPDQQSNLVHYLSHHVVVKETSQTTKIRVVINGSLSGSNGISLNDILFKGFTNWSLLDSMMRLRKHEFILIGDITKAFLMIGVALDHRDLLRFLWITPDNELITFRFKRVPFGTSASPFLLFSALSKTFFVDVTEEKDRQTLCQSFYVDDFVNSFTTETERDHIQQLCSNALASRGLVINWKTESSFNVLGHGFDAVHDCLSINFPRDLKDPVCIGDLLSIIPQIYDPCGLLSPYTTAMRRVMSQAWKREKHYDGTLTPEERSETAKRLENIRTACSIPIPRRVMFTNEVTFHVYSDASQDTKGLCVYVVSAESARLVYAKSRLHHRSTIPEAEFDALIMSIEILPQIQKIFNPSHIFFWTDSTINVSRMAETSVNKLTFHQALKVLRFKETFESYSIGHVPGTQNPADSITKLSTKFDVEKWLVMASPTIAKVNIANITVPQSNSSPIDCSEILHQIELASTYADLCSRFPMRSLIIATQQSAWPKEYQVLVQHRRIEFKSPLRHYALSTIDDVIYIHLRHDYDHPKILLPYDSTLTELLIHHIHEDGHVGTISVQSKFCEQYFCFKLRRTILNFIRRCRYCRLKFSKPPHIPTGLLPEFRLQVPDHAFQVISIDFTKMHVGDTTKIVLIAVCAHSRAIFLESVTNQTALSVLTALHKLFAIYGVPKLIYSDNEICLHKSSKVLIELSKCIEQLNSKFPGLQWHFSVPHHPASNGITERLIGVTKRVLVGIGLQRDTSAVFFELFLAEATRLVNSRPIFKTDQRYVTPYDLILGHTPTTLSQLEPFRPHQTYSEIRIFNSLQRGLGRFWKSWIQHYFLSLRNVCASNPKSTIALNDTVVLVEPHKVPKDTLKIGTVIAVYPGRDGTIRVCDVRVSDSELLLRRATKNLIRLPQY